MVDPDSNYLTFEELKKIFVPLKLDQSFDEIKRKGYNNFFDKSDVNKWYNDYGYKYAKTKKHLN